MSRSKVMFEIVKHGLETTIQELPGRIGHFCLLSGGTRKASTAGECVLWAYR